MGNDTTLMCSEQTASEIDKKVIQVVGQAYEKAEHLLKENMAKLHELAKFLYEKETINGEEFMEILQREPEKLTSLTKE